MKQKLIWLLTFILITQVHCVEKDNETVLPSPAETIVKTDMEEGSKKKARREWIELMHQSDSTVYWKQIEARRAILNQPIPESQRTGFSNTPSSTNISIAGDSLVGFWDEKGSNNQAGSVIATTYDTSADEIYLVSAGGSLFKGARAGNQWQVVNQSLRFSGDLLEFVETDNGKRLIAFIEGIPAWSDNEGNSWNTVENWMPYTDGWGGIYHPVISRDSQTIITMAKPSYWSNLSIWYSDDQGESYQKIRDLDSHDPNQYDILTVHHSNEVLFIDKANADVIDIYHYDEKTKEFYLSNFVEEQGFGEDGRANMSAVKVNDSTNWYYFYDANNDVYHSDDNGDNWTYQATLPARPWGVGLYILPSDPEYLLMGAVECFKSDDRGKTWQKQNSWGEYYSNVESKLHADMMYFREFSIPGIDTFIAISNHGGLNLSYDKMKTVENIGMEGLNVSQYYSVRTNLIDPSIMYAGSQDQGFQVAYNDRLGPLDFNQTISGDYGHIVFSEEGRRLWTVYPGGWVTYYENPITSPYYNLSFDLESEDETVWIPPLAESARTSENEIYMAGGNIDGGEGSFLIHLTVQNNEIVPSQINFDFKEASGGTISAIHNSIADPKRIYVATTNGNFYFSDNYGKDWTKGIVRTPGSHYLYGASIVSSKSDPTLIFIGGSGYSTAPVLSSINGGRTFFAFDKGLPPTTVFGLALDESRQLLFAATESGPYVCFIESGQWYPMGGNKVPNQTYWSVDFVESENLVRFGTYGRGIWDFYIESVSSNNDIQAQYDLVVYPNPMTDFLIVESQYQESSVLEVHDMNGRILKSMKPSDIRTKLDLSNLSSGTYIVSLRNKNGILSSKKIVKE